MKNNMMRKRALTLLLLLALSLLPLFAVSCGEEEEPQHTHELTSIAAKAPTCTEDGNNAYYLCSSCGKAFSDAEGKNETTSEAQKLPALGHQWAGDCDGTCDRDGCNATREEGSHTDADLNGVCDICGESLIPQGQQEEPIELPKDRF